MANVTELRECVEFMKDKNIDMLVFAEKADCGTVACLAGWQTIRLHPEWSLKQIDERAMVMAQNSFELSDSEVSYLFNLGSWPYKFRFNYNLAFDFNQRWLALHDRVEHFIATGE